MKLVSNQVCRKHSQKCLRNHAKKSWMQLALPEEQIKKIEHDVLMVHGREDLGDSL